MKQIILLFSSLTLSVLFSEACLADVPNAGNYRGYTTSGEQCFLQIETTVEDHNFSIMFVQKISKNTGEVITFSYDLNQVTYEENKIIGRTGLFMTTSMLTVELNEKRDPVSALYQDAYVNFLCNLNGAQ